jgi:uncharacterized UPF0160 family protein
MVLRSFGTHDGTFHADEVTACALLLLYGLIDRDKIIRTRNPVLLEQCEFVCDVGGIYDPKKKRFDHHQSAYTGELSSAGMVWLYLLEEGFIDEQTYDFFNRSLILGVDAHDNGRSIHEVGVSTFSHIISNFVPPAYDVTPEEQNAAFEEALDFVFNHLRRLKERFQYIRACRQKVADAMASQSNVLIFDHAIPWIDSFFDLGGEKHPAAFVIMPSGGHWKLRAIPPHSEDRMKVRIPLPEKWAGLRDEELQKVSGIRGGIFCHKGRFISVWMTKEDALAALQLVLKEQHGNRFRPHH